MGFTLIKKWIICFIIIIIIIIFTILLSNMEQEICLQLYFPSAAFKKGCQLAPLGLFKLIT